MLSRVSSVSVVLDYILLLLRHIAHSHHTLIIRRRSYCSLLADPARDTMDPDKLARGIKDFVVGNSNADSLYPVYDFLARYVRKLHSDRYIKKTLADNPGKSFLAVIGPSDVAYVISLLKNSIDVWKYDIERPEGARPKPLYTKGENMKKEFGKTGWNAAGMQYFEDALKAWKKVFSTANDNPHFTLLSGGWNEWLQDVGTNINPAGWTRKDLSRVLATRQKGDTAVDDDSESDDALEDEEEAGYDSDDDGAPRIGPGRASRWEGEEVGDEDNDNMGSGDVDDEDNIMDGGPPAARARRTIRDDDEESEDEEEGRVEIRESGTKTTGETEEDYLDDEEAEGDNSPISIRRNRGTGSTRGLGGGRNANTRRLFELPEDEIEDVEGENTRKDDKKKQKKKKRKKNNLLESSPEGLPEKRVRLARGTKDV